MSEGRLYFLNKPYPGRPVEEKYFTEINGLKEFFVTKEDALLYLFDQGVRNFQYLTKGFSDYKSTKNLLTYELWHVENRVGYVQYDYERYEDENGELKQRRAFVWRFVGFGRSLFASSREELKEKVVEIIQHYNDDPAERGYNKYPFYTRHNRLQERLISPISTLPKAQSSQSSPKGAYKPMKNFIAFDFETANNSRHSICSVGMVFVQDGQIVDSLYQLINPEEDFDDFNIRIHGITPSDVEFAPTFDQFYETVRSKMQNQLMVAHNLAFDGYALRDNLARYEIQPVSNHLLCTYQLSKKLVPGQLSYSIKSLCQHYEIDLVNHHHALDDAIACANLMIKLTEQHELGDFDTLYSKTFIKPGEIAPNRYRSSLTSKISSKLDLSAIEVATKVAEHSDFYEKNIVFTGRLSVFTRKEAAQLVASRGGRPQNGLNSDTDYIILGGFDDVMIKGNKSSKLEKAEKLIREGKELEIISEEDFLKML